MADFGSIGGRPETAGDGAGRLSASELRPVDAAGREWPAELVALVGAVVDVVEEDLETELAEARREADELRARVAALEAAVTGTIGAFPVCGWCGCGTTTLRDINGVKPCCDSCNRQMEFPVAETIPVDLDPLRDALSGGTSALDAVVSAAVAEERARIRARVEALYLPDAFRGNVVPFNRALDQALGAIGGAP